MRFIMIYVVIFTVPLGIAVGAPIPGDKGGKERTVYPLSTHTTGSPPAADPYATWPYDPISSTQEQEQFQEWLKNRPQTPPQRAEGHGPPTHTPSAHQQPNVNAHLNPFPFPLPQLRYRNRNPPPGGHSGIFPEQQHAQPQSLDPNSSFDSNIGLQYPQHSAQTRSSTNYYPGYSQQGGPPQPQSPSRTKSYYPNDPLQQPQSSDPNRHYPNAQYPRTKGNELQDPQQLPVMPKRTESGQRSEEKDLVHGATSESGDETSGDSVDDNERRAPF